MMEGAARYGWLQDGFHSRGRGAGCAYDRSDGHVQDAHMIDRTDMCRLLWEMREIVCF